MNSNNPVSLGASFFKGIKWKSLSQFLLMGSQFGVTIVLARILTPADFGIYGIVQIFMIFSLALIKNILGPAMVQKNKLSQRQVGSGFSLGLLTGIILMVALWLAAVPLSIFFRTHGLKNIFRLLSMVFVFQGLAAAPFSILRRNMDYKSLFFIVSGSYILGYGGVSIACACMGLGVYSFIYGLIAQSGITFLLTFYLYMKQGHPVYFRWCGREIAEILRFGKWATLSNLVSKGANRGDYFIIGRWLGSTALGIYTRAYYFMQAASAGLVAAFSEVLFPLLSRMQKDKKRISQAVMGFMPPMALFVLSAMAFVIGNARELVLFLLGSQWYLAVVPLQILCFFGIFIGMINLMQSIFLSIGAVRSLCTISVFYMGMIVLASLLGMKWGIIGVSLGVGVGILLTFFVMALMISFLLHMKFRQWVTMAKPVLYYGTMFVLAFAGKYGLHIQDRLVFPSLILGVILWFLLWGLILFVFRFSRMNREFYQLLGRLQVSMPDFFRK